MDHLLVLTAICSDDNDGWGDACGKVSTCSVRYSRLHLLARVPGDLVFEASQEVENVYFRWTAPERAGVYARLIGREGTVGVLAVIIPGKLAVASLQIAMLEPRLQGV
jgi:hypothetical protein